MKRRPHGPSAYLGVLLALAACGPGNSDAAPGVAGLIEFRLVESEPSAGSERAMLNGEPLTLSPTVLISDDDIQGLAPVIRSDGLILSLQLTEEGRQKLRRATGENIGRRMALILDGQVRSAPVIRDTIAGPSVQVPVQASEAEAEEILTRLRSRWPDPSGGEPAPPGSAEERK